MLNENAFSQSGNIEDANNSIQNRETLKDTLQNALNNKSNSRPPKMEVRGVLIPNKEIFKTSRCRFKLSTRSTEYLLRIPKTLIQVAKKTAWQVVTVKGYLNFDSNILDVEKIICKQNVDTLKVPYPWEKIFDLGLLAKEIHRYGWIEPSVDYLVS